MYGYVFRGQAQTLPILSTDKHDNATSVLVQQSPFSIVSTSRLDNRAELKPILSSSDTTDNTLIDAVLILNSYKKWGVDCPEYLRGTFAFVIMDERDNTLFCARDHLGIAPFYYHLSKQLFVFGTSLRAVLEHSKVPVRLNETAIVGYLGQLFNPQTDPDHTFFGDVQRLRAGSWLKITPDNAIQRTYWQPTPTAPVHFPNEQAYIERFTELLQQAIHGRINDANTAGVLLSGGLDSSAIVGLAEAAKLHTFYLQPMSDDCDESKYVNSVVAARETVHHTLPMPPPIVNLIDVLPDLDTPVYGPNFPLQLDTFRAVKSLGIDVLLDGNDGDNVVGYGLGNLYELAWRGNWKQFLKLTEIRQQRRRGSIGGHIRYYGMPVLRQRLRRGNLIAVGSGLLHLRLHSPMSVHWLAREIFRPSPQLPGAEVNPVIPTDIANRYALHQQIKHYPVAYATAQEEQAAILSSGYINAMFNEIESAKRLSGLKVRHPFADVRLLEFCLNLPSEYRLVDGWDRWIMRKAIEARLPEQVVWRPDKTDLFPHVLHGAQYHDHEIIRQVVFDRDYRSDYLDPTGMQTLYHRFIEKPDALTHRLLSRAVVFALWQHHSTVARL